MKTNRILLASILLAAAPAIYAQSTVDAMLTVGKSPHRPAANYNEGDDVEITVTTTAVRLVESTANVLISVVTSDCIPGQSTENYFRCDYIATDYLNRELQIRIPPNRNTGVLRVPTRNNDRIDNKVTFRVAVDAGSETGLRFTDDKTETFVVGDEEVPLVGKTLAEDEECRVADTNDTCDYADKILISTIPISNDTPVPEGDGQTWVRHDIWSDGRLHNTLPINGTYSNYDFALVHVNAEGSASRHNDYVDADVTGTVHFPAGSTTVYTRAGIVNHPQLEDGESFVFWLFQNGLTEKTIPACHPQYTGDCPVGGGTDDNLDVQNNRGASIKIVDDDVASYEVASYTYQPTNQGRPTFAIEIREENGDCIIPFPTEYNIAYSDNVVALEASGVIESRETHARFPPCTADRDIFNVAAMPPDGEYDLRVTLQYTGTDRRIYRRAVYWDVHLNCAGNSCARTVIAGPAVAKPIIQDPTPQPRLPGDLLPCGTDRGVGCYFITQRIDNTVLPTTAANPRPSTSGPAAGSRSSCLVDQSKATSYGASDDSTARITQRIRDWYSNGSSALRDCPIINTHIQACTLPGSMVLRQDLRYHEVCFVAGDPNTRQFYVYNRDNWPGTSRSPARATSTRSVTSPIATDNAEQRRLHGWRVRQIGEVWCGPLDLEWLRPEQDDADGSDEPDPPADPLSVKLTLDSEQDFDLCVWPNDEHWSSNPLYGSCRGDTGMLPTYANLAMSENLGMEEITVETATGHMACIAPNDIESGAWIYRVRQTSED